jgi:hypothetical protein
MAFTLLANLPARHAFAVRERQFGRGFSSSLFLGAFADLGWLGPVFAVAILGAAVATKKMSATRMGRRVAPLVTPGIIVAVFAAMWLVSVAATEFRLQRGAYPSIGETLQGLRDTSFVRGSMGILLFERYSGPTILAVSLASILLVIHEKTHQALASSRGLVAALSMAGGAAILLAVARISFAGAMPEHSAPPLVGLAAGLFSAQRAKHEPGVRGVLEGAHFDEASVRSGLALYGFDPAAATGLLDGASARCPRRHPLARALAGSIEPKVEPVELVSALTRLSQALFAAPDERLIVWHVALESFRADDVHALHDAAPPEVTPFTNAVYDGARGAAPASVAFPQAFQAGVRTAQAISGALCGLGALPFQLALSRDLVDLPLRCAPDVLHDAGFAARIFYGGDASFEKLGAFARAHHLEVVDQATLPPDLPRGAWRAVTDAALFSAALRGARTGSSLQYNFVLSLSGHTPFDRPEDVSPAILGRIGALVRQRALPSEDDGRRLLTIAYTDDALMGLIENVEHSSDASHSLFIVSADHATADSFLWDRPDERATAAIPLFIYFPRAMLASDDARERVRELNRLAGRTPVSLDDVPSMLLALLAHHPALQRLSEDRRWHTLGGAGTSPFAAVPGSGSLALWGIDALSRVFTVGRAAPFPVVGTEERSVPFSVWEEPLGPVLRDGTAALSSIFASAKGCPPD